jgi:putative membrane protein insertion efficiency factor
VAGRGYGPVMVWSRRYERRYDPRYGDPYGYRGGWRRGPSGGSCFRDACLLETGCCVGEAIDNNCLVAGLLLSPRLALTMSRAGRGGAGRAGAGHGAGPGGAGNGAARAAVAGIRLYQREISAYRAPCCRFSPSCSRYAIDAIETHGAVRGLALAARRLLRCRPGGARGADPVPVR